MKSENVAVAVTGAVYWVPLSVDSEIIGTTDLESLAGAEQLGFVDGEGVSINDESSREDIKAWQNNALVRQVSSETSVSISATLIETTKAVRALYFRSEEDAAGVTSWKPANQVRGRLVVDYFDPSWGALEAGDESLMGRFVFNDVTVTETEELSLVNGDALGYGVTWKATPDATGEVAKIYNVVKTSEA